MRKYKNFNIPMIKKHLKAIEEYKNKIDLNKISENNLANLDNTIKFYEDILNQNEITTYFEHSKEASLLEIRDFNNKYLKLIENYIPCYETFNDRAYTAIEKYNLINIYNAILENPENDTTYTNKHALSLTHDFYNSLPDKEIRDIFNKEYKKKCQNIRFKDENSVTFYSKMIDYNFITIGNASNFEKIPALAHEYGHIINDKITKEFIDYESNYPFVELLSMFMETLSMDYLNQKNNLKRAITLELQQFMEIYNLSYKILVLDDTKNLTYNNEEKLKEFYKDNYGEIFLENNANITIDYDHNYTFPYIVIIELLHEYNKDPEKALYLLKEIVKLKNCDYIKELNNKGIHLNTHINNYAKQLTKKVYNSYHY